MAPGPQFVKYFSLIFFVTDRGARRTGTPQTQPVVTSARATPYRLRRHGVTIKGEGKKDKIIQESVLLTAVARYAMWPGGPQ